MSDLSVTQTNPYAGVPKLDTRMLGRHAARLLDQFGLLRGDGSREDAGFTATFARELEYRYTELFNFEYPQFKARSLVPVDNRVPSGADYFTYRSYDKVGNLARVVHNYSDDSPTADVKGHEFPQRIFSLSSSYQYSIQDMRASAMAGVPLEALKAENAREMIERKLEDLAAFGTTEVNVNAYGAATQAAYGLLNAPNVNATTQVSSGTWQAQYLADTSTGRTTSIGAIQSDIAAMRGTIYTQTKGDHGNAGQCDLVVPTSVFVFLDSTPRSIQYDGTGQTLKEYLEKACGLKSIVQWNRSDGYANGVTGSPIEYGQVTMYEKDPRCLSLIMSQEFEQFAPQPRNMSFVINCHARTGSVEVRYPLWMTKMTGVSI